MCANIRPTSLIGPSEIEINIPPPMGQDTCVYVYVPWQIQKRGVLVIYPQDNRNLY